MSNDDREYQRQYYEEHQAERSEHNRWRWENDPEYKRREIERSRKRRALKRAEKASDRFQEMVESKRGDLTTTEVPRPIILNRRKVWVYTTGSLGREVGRSPRVIREWLNEGVLPGASTFVKGAALFTVKYGEAVRRACERLYYLDGRGCKRVLKRLIHEELFKGKISFIPLGGAEADRTTAVSAV